MLSRRAFFTRLLGHPEARSLLLNSLAVGDADSARDLDRVAALVPDPTLARRIYRHYAEELRHRRLFPGGLDVPQLADPMPVPLRVRPRATRATP